MTPTGTLSSSDRGRGRTPSPGPSGPVEKVEEADGTCARCASRVGARAGVGPCDGRGARRRGRSAVSVRMPLTRWPPGVVSWRVAKPSVVEANAHRDLGRLAGGGLGQPDDRDAGRRGASEQLRDPRLPACPDGAPLPGSAGEGSPPGPGSVRSRIATSCGLASARAPVNSEAEGWPPAVVGSRAWGSQVVHSHAGRALGGWIASILRSSGAWKAASSHSRERARARVPAGGPVRARTPSWRSGTTTGAPGSQAVRRTTSSAASSSSGSCSTRGPPAGSRRALAARGTGPRPTRTVRKSASAGRRSQRRSVWSTMAQSAGGPGWRCSATASWVAARWSAWDATCSRWAR